MILKNQRIFLGEREFTVDSAALAVETGCEPQDDTRFQGPTRIFGPGLLTAGWSIGGFWKQAVTSGDVDDTLFGKIGLDGVPFTAFANGQAIGDRAYFLNTLASEYVPLGGEVGAPHKFTAGGQARGRAVRGTILHYGTQTATGNATGVQVGAADTGNVIYAALHVIAVSGTAPTLTVRLQRDNANTFPSATNEATFAQATAITSEYLEDSNGNSDDWWRADWTIGGTNPSFTFALVMGIHSS